LGVHTSFHIIVHIKYLIEEMK